jgi:hypothetical protein
MMRVVVAWLANFGGAGDLWLWRLTGARKFTWISCGGAAWIQTLWVDGMMWQSNFHFHLGKIPDI